MTATVLLAVAFGLALSLGLTAGVRLLARRLGVVAKPRPDRWHHKPTPLLGGVAMAAAFASVALVFMPARDALPVVAPALLLTAVGLFDDLRGLNPATKLVLQTVIAAAVLLLGYRLTWTGSLTTDSLLTLLWLVGLANAFNLLDNMDGLAAGVAAIGAAAYLGLALLTRDAEDAVLMAALLGVSTGFLVFNFQPASIFMGDAGSLFLGFTLALVATKTGASIGAGGTTAILVPVAILAIPIFDTVLVTFVRTLAGRRLSAGGQDHSSHRLVALGLPERRAVLVFYVLAAAGGIAGLSVAYLGIGNANVIVAAFIVVVTLFGIRLAKVHVYVPEQVGAPNGAVRLVVNAIGSRTAGAEVLLDVVLIAICYYTAYRIRFPDPQFKSFFPVFLKSLPAVVAVSVAALWWMDAYRGIWKYFGAIDAIRVAEAVALSMLGSIAAVSYLFRFEHFSRGVFPICGLLMGMALSAARASFRIFDAVLRTQSRRRAVIFGAGDPGLGALRHLAANEPLDVHVVAFVDDDARKHSRSIQGIRVAGGFDHLLRMVNGREVDGVVLATRLSNDPRLDILRRACWSQSVFLWAYRSGFEDLLEIGGETVFNAGSSTDITMDARRSRESRR